MFLHPTPIIGNLQIFTNCKLELTVTTSSWQALLMISSGTDHDQQIVTARNYGTAAQACRNYMESQSDCSS